MGFWLRNMAEECLIATRGDLVLVEDAIDEVLVATKGAVKPWRCQRPNWVEAPAGEHSEKPDEVRRLICDMTGEPSSRRNVELFARKLVPGWTCLGDAVTGRDIRIDLRDAAGRLFD
jgi:N6-adenosine-specific RNA methylase IME4